jgi:hypothetical protein
LDTAGNLQSNQGVREKEGEEGSRIKALKMLL